MQIFLLGLVFTIISGILCVVFFRAEGNQKKIFMYITGVFFSIVSGLRDNTIGTDTRQFYQAFQMIGNDQYGWLDYEKTRYEIGYFWLNKLVGIFTEDPQIFILITSSIIVIGVFYFIYHNSSNVLYSVLLYQTMYNYCNSMNLVRQYIALAIAINSFTYLKKNKMGKAYILVIIAGLFHTSALILLPVLIMLSKINISSKNIYKILGSVIAVTTLTPLLIKLVVKIFPRYEFYLTYSSIFTGGRIMPLVYLLMIFSGYFLLAKLKKIDENNENYYYTSVYVLIGAVLLIVASVYFESASRLTNYFLIYFIVFVPELFRIFNKQSRIMLYGTFLFITILYYIILLNNGVAGVFPFKFYWQ